MRKLPRVLASSVIRGAQLGESHGGIYLVDLDRGIAEFDHRLPRPAAEANAFNSCLVEWLNRNPVHSPADSCLGCGAADRPNDPLLAVGIAGAGQAWLHRQCIAAWHAARIVAAVVALQEMDIVAPRPT